MGFPLALGYSKDFLRCVPTMCLAFSVFRMVVIGACRERRRGGGEIIEEARVLQFLCRFLCKANVSAFSSICEVTSHMIRMMISKGCFFSVDLFDRFWEQERKTRIPTLAAYRTAKGGTGHEADRYENSSRSRCPYPTLGHIFHLSEFAVLYLPRRCSSRSMQMRKVSFEKKKT